MTRYDIVIDTDPPCTITLTAPNDGAVADYLADLRAHLREGRYTVYAINEPRQIIL